jgi:hypothetical protein
MAARSQFVTASHQASISLITDELDLLPAGVTKVRYDDLGD